jgi:hypothetical protein
VSVSSGVLQTTLAAATIPDLGYRDGFSEAASAMGIVAALGILVVLFPVLGGRWSVVRKTSRVLTADR